MRTIINLNSAWRFTGPEADEAVLGRILALIGLEDGHDQ